MLADNDANWRPERFAYGAPGFENQFVYAMKKLVDFADRQPELEASDNPFALAVLAHLKTQETRGDAKARLAWKLRLMRMLLERTTVRQCRGAVRSHNNAAWLPPHLRYHCRKNRTSTCL